MTTFDSNFDVGDVVCHVYTKEVFVVRHVVFGASEAPAYRCFPERGLHCPGVNGVQDNFIFDEAELEFASGV